MDVADFSADVRAILAQHLAPGTVECRGSIASGTFDEWSDIDLEATVNGPLDAAFFCALEQRLQDAFGQALVRYDPAYLTSTTSQDVRFSFYDLPIFWRVDLLVHSRVATSKKYPDPFPAWSPGSSALMNVIWAFKYQLRKRDEDAQRYLTAACEKIGVTTNRSSIAGATLVLFVLEERDDVDRVLLAKTRDAIGVS